MATPVLERERGETTPTVERNARLSANRRRSRPLPATRREADELYAPSPAYSQKPASAPRLVRMQQLGLIPQFTNAEAHRMILDALYPPAT